MTIRLRAHHLLCLLTWAGKGYSPAFTAGFTAIAARIAAGEAVTVVDGPDDVCAPMLDDPGCHCRGDSVARRDARAARDVAALLGRPVAPGQRLVLDPAALDRMRRAFAQGRIRSACAGCDWAGLCRDIAKDGFAATVLPAPQPDRLRA
ncbi:DUF1284 domain-containing protein [Paracoccus sp. S3-43]|uniref:DUF1284 domain-containing protein n=1 Tax=Paracoccus sp. S3-43 TaxID=3030011 RepID=UPI0023AF60D7|nr:DUF1284 domain-containing protein [Paracoccus sp. S3-43]WEF24906.1 DUF1284 domain-containing protein [Paracoccus sp. S3-43]